MAFRTLIAADDLASHADAPDWRIFDCRHDLARPQWGGQAYREGHIPNAQFLSLEDDLSGRQSGTNGRHPLPDPAALAAKLGACGVSTGSQIIAYDDAGGVYAARLWWLLRWLGHATVAVLDGGLPAWRRAGYALTRETPRVAPAVFHERVGQRPVTTPEVEACLQDAGLLLLDARAADRFRGENETLDPAAGHIPGAVNRPFRDNLAADGRFKPAGALRAELEALLGNRPAETIAAYCGSGVTACHNLLALEIAGWRGARLYAGSWSEWCSDRARPVATGTED